MWVIFTVTGARLSSPSRIWPPSSWPRGPALYITLSGHSADCLLSVLQAMLIRVAAHKNQARTRQLYHYIQHTSCSPAPDMMGNLKMGHFNQNPCPRSLMLAERGKWKVCKKIFARQKIFSVHSLGSSCAWSRAGSRAVSGLFHVSLGIIKSALCLFCPPSRRQDTAVEGRQMQLYV